LKLKEWKVVSISCLLLVWIFEKFRTSVFDGSRGLGIYIQNYFRGLGGMGGPEYI
jgi:hypothetical protein